MLSISHVSADAPEVASIRHPCVEMSISRAPVRLRPGSRVGAASRSPVRVARRRSGGPSNRTAESVMASSLSPLGCARRVNKWFSNGQIQAVDLLAVGNDHGSTGDAELAHGHRKAAAV